MTHVKLAVLLFWLGIVSGCYYVENSRYYEYKIETLSRWLMK